MRAKNQHWVPQFYLRYFASQATFKSDNPQVWIFSKDSSDGNEKLTSVRNVCAQRYLYSPLKSAGERDWSLDDRLNELESLLSSFWSDLAYDYVDLGDKDIRKALALFVAVMYLRNPQVRRKVEEIHSEAIAFFSSLPALPDGTPNIDNILVKDKLLPFQAGDWHKYKAWNKEDHDKFFVNTLRGEATRIAGLFMLKRWSIVFTEVETFITTDNPVTVNHQKRTTFGLGTEGTLVSFPLSPFRMLVFDDLHEEPVNRYYPLSEGVGAALNFTTWRGAKRFLITGRPIPEVLEEMLTLEDSNGDA
jgi:Protein of unknown function (DUF4238)